ncbi:MAG: OmpA family protein [Candidatus Cloacimonetes bacterium]|nr:OmpA family protein [Candidatus Cloacimonadota bacterium]
MSFSDLLSGLLVLFILATLVLLIQLLEAQEAVEERTKIVANSITELELSRQEQQQKSERLEQMRIQIDTTQQQLQQAEKLIEETQMKLGIAKEEILEAIRELSKSEFIRREILRDLKQDLNAMGIQVEVADNESILRIPTSVLAFESNQYDIPLQSQEYDVVGKIGEVLYRRLLQEDRYLLLDTVFVEGHTDSRLSAREKGNWGLSTFRAISVWQWWQDSSGVSGQLQFMKNHRDQPMFSVSGYAATRRIQEVELTAEQLEKNRRIDIRFTSRRPALESFQAIQKLLHNYSQ